MATNNDGFPYTDRQQRWWFAQLHEGNPRVAVRRGVEEMVARERSRITPSQPTPEQGARLGLLINRKEAEIRARADMTMEWTPTAARNAWVVRDSTGAVIRRFPTGETAYEFVQKEAAKAAKRG